jgi:hypothetical protein
VEEAVFFSSCVLGSFVKNQLAVAVWIYVWVFYSNPFVSMSVFVPVPCYFYCYGSMYSLKSEIVIPPTLDILLKIALSIQGPRNFVSAFSYIVIFTILILLIHSMGELSIF